MVDAQAVIQALIRAQEAPPEDEGGPRKPVITISRERGTGGDAIAEALSKALGLPIYNKELLNAVAKHAGVNEKLMSTLHEKVNSASDSWLYAMVFGKNVTRDDYRHALVTSIRAIYRTGGIIVGRGAHVVLAGRDVLRVRITGSKEVCAKRVALRENISISEAKELVKDKNEDRGKYVWDTFHSRLNDVQNFDITINTDHFPDYQQVVDILLAAAKALRLDQQTVGMSNR